MTETRNEPDANGETDRKNADIPPASSILRTPDREKTKLTEILLILVIILLGASSVYFYQSNERLTERYNSLSKGLDETTSDIAVLKEQKDSEKALLMQMKLDVEGVVQTNEIIKDRMLNLSEGQQENVKEINRIVTRISTTEKEEAIKELKRALLVVNSIKQRESTPNSKAIGEKLEAEIQNLLSEFTGEGKTVAKTEEAVPKSGVGEVLLQEAPQVTKEDKPMNLPEANAGQTVVEEKPTQTNQP